MRIILYTGKGGVGKTSVAAATAILAAEMGYRTAIMSSDPAHSLADSLNVDLGPEPVPVLPRLWGQEIDVLKELEVYWRTVQEWIVAVMRWQGMSEVMAEEVAVLPGMEELTALLYIVRHSEQARYDLLVVDCAPTAETLRLLSFPDMAQWYMHRLFPIQRTVAKAIGPVARSVLRLPAPGREVFDSIQALYQQLEKVRSLLLSPSKASVRLVVNPEKMVIKEAQRTFTYMNLYGYNVDLVVCNKVLPEIIDDRFFDDWKANQVRYLELIHECFDPIPVLMAPLMAREAVGQESLREMGREVFGTQDPTRLFYTGHAQEIIAEGKRHALKVKLPFVSQQEISVLESPEELTIQAGHYRRNILLPRRLAGLEVEEAAKEGDILTIRFKERDRAVSRLKGTSENQEENDG